MKMTPYLKRVEEFIEEGLTRSDAQGVADLEGHDDSVEVYFKKQVGEDVIVKTVQGTKEGTIVDYHTVDVGPDKGKLSYWIKFETGEEGGGWMDSDILY